MTSQLHAKFTTNVLATEDIACERRGGVCNTIIRQGDKRYYIENQNPHERGLYLCYTCFKYYDTKASTIRRPAVAIGAPAARRETSASSAPSVDVPGIRRGINEAQRQGSHTPHGRVTAMPQYPARPVVGNLTFTHGSQSVAASSSALPSPLGYTSEHLRYTEQRDRWQRAAYPSGYPAFGNQELRITVKLGYYESHAQKGELMMTGIKEGLSVQYTILPQQLFHAAAKPVLEELEKLRPEFRWDTSQMTLREKLNWQDVLKAVLDSPYFHGRYLKKANAKSKSAERVVFAAPTKAPEFVFVVNTAHWELARVPGMEISLNSDEEMSMQSLAVSSRVKRKVPPSPEKPRRPTDDSKRAQLGVFSAANTHDLSTAQSTSSSTSSATPPASIIPMPSSSQAAAPQEPEGTSTSVAGRPSLDSQVVSKAFSSVSASEIQEAMLAGGSREGIAENRKKFDALIHEQVICYIVKTIEFEQLLALLRSTDNSESKYFVDRTAPFIGTISYNLRDDFIGNGAFKLTISAILLWTASPPVGLRSPPGTPIPIALKRPYMEEVGKPNEKVMKFKRFGVSDESDLMHHEVNTHGWAQSLLEFTYRFIDEFISEHGAPPFEVMRLRFVHAVLAYAQKSVEGGRYQSSHRAVFLLEELLDKSQFVKYIHNAGSVPLLDPHEADFETAVFLCFVQHVQYQITDHMVFTSDFQGCGTMLTDPQIISKPIMLPTENGDQILGSFFGEGNIREAYDEFPSRHQCNVYCKWFKLEPLVVSGDSHDSTAS